MNFKERINYLLEKYDQNNWSYAFAALPGNFPKQTYLDEYT